MPQALTRTCACSSEHPMRLVNRRSYCQKRKCSLEWKEQLVNAGSVHLNGSGVYIRRRVQPQGSFSPRINSIKLDSHKLHPSPRALHLTLSSLLTPPPPLAMTPISVGFFKHRHTNLHDAYLHVRPVLPSPSTKSQGSVVVPTLPLVHPELTTYDQRRLLVAGHQGRRVRVVTM